MNGLVPLSKGEVNTDDHGILSNKADWRAHQRRTAMVFQSHQLIEQQTALTNVLMGRLGYRSRLQTLVPYSRADKLLALECLERVGLLDNALNRVSNLSGGERQRVGIARALAQQPTMVLADEPVASLDPATSRKVMDFFRKICDESKLTVIVSLHQVDIAKEFADKIIGVSAGRILFNGTVKDLSLEKLRIIYGTAVANE
jgi:phosphonate transport system ATP-binding protein